MDALHCGLNFRLVYRSSYNSNLGSSPKAQQQTAEVQNKQLVGEGSGTYGSLRARYFPQELVQSRAKRRIKIRFTSGGLKYSSKWILMLLCLLDVWIVNCLLMLPTTTQVVKYWLMQVSHVNQKEKGKKPTFKLSLVISKYNAICKVNILHTQDFYWHITLWIPILHL